MRTRLRTVLLVVLGLAWVVMPWRLDSGSPVSVVAEAVATDAAASAMQEPGELPFRTQDGEHELQLARGEAEEDSSSDSEVVCDLHHAPLTAEVARHHRIVAEHRLVGDEHRLVFLRPPERARG